MAFRLRRSRLRGSASDRLRGGVTVAAAAGTVYPGTSVAGLTPGIRLATTMNPGPRPRVGVIMAGMGMTPTVRAAVPSRGPLIVSIGGVRTVQPAVLEVAVPRPAQGQVKIRPTTEVVISTDGLVIGA